MKIVLSSKGHHYLARAGILLIMVALITGMAGCDTRPPNSPIGIRNWYDLQAISGNLSADYILMNDLDRNTAGYTELASQTANGGKGWQPLGISYPYFKGLFDGQGYEIRDCFINRPDEERVGLFKQITFFAVIRNVGVVNATVIGYDYVGGVVGYNWKTVNNCHFSGNVTGKVHVGGLVGGNSNLGTVSDSYSTGSVTGDKQVGGLVGDNFGEGTVSNSYSTGNVIGDELLGGLLGYNEGTVSDSYSTGNVSGNNYVGGLLGANDEDGTVDNSYSTGSVTGTEAVGGLVGMNYGIVSNSHSAGNVTGDSSVGGLVGSNDGAVSNSFWDIETSGQYTSGGGTGKTTAEMHDIATFSGATWDIVAVGSPGIRNPSYIWNIVDDETYPFLSWES